MKKLLVHNLSIRYGRYDPAAFLFDENALFFAESGDIVVSRRKIPDEYVSFLKQIQCIPEKIHFVFPKNYFGSHTMTSIFEDVGVIRDIAEKKDEYKKMGDFLTLDTFALTEHEVSFAQKLDIGFTGRYEDYYFFGNKSTFRSLAKQNMLPVPNGYEDKKGLYDQALAAAILFFRGASEVIIKQDEGVAGIGSIRIAKKNFVSGSQNPLSFFSAAHRIIPVKSGASVVEEWHRDVVFSPSIQLYIESSGDIKIYSIHNQLFYENKVTYRGCTSFHWLPEDIKKIVTNRGVEFARVLSAQGYRGHLSFNTIILSDGTLLFNEVNPRRVMSSYPFQIVQRCGGAGASGLRYVSSRVQKNNWRGKDIVHVLTELSPLLFSQERKRGIIPYDHGLLHSKGLLSLLSIGSNSEEAEGFLSHALSI